MKDFCKYLSVANLVLGTLGSFFLAKIQGMQLDNDLMMSRNWGTTIIIFIVSMVIVASISATLYAIYEMISNQEVILKKIESSESNIIEKTTASDDIPSDKWKCNNCGTINANYVGTCRCGTSKH